MAFVHHGDKGCFCQTILKSHLHTGHKLTAAAATVTQKRRLAANIVRYMGQIEAFRLCQDFQHLRFCFLLGKSTTHQKTCTASQHHTGLFDRGTFPAGLTQVFLLVSAIAVSDRTKIGFLDDLLGILVISNS